MSAERLIQFGTRSGGEAEAVAAVQFWAECVRREHHGWMFNSQPRLFRPISALQRAAAEKRWRRMLRLARLVRDRFRRDEHAYCPALRVWRPTKDQLCLTLSSMVYLVGRAIFDGRVFLHVTVWREPVWRCEVSYAAPSYAQKPFPDYEALFRQPELTWRLAPSAADAHVVRLPTFHINYGLPYRDVPP